MSIATQLRDKYYVKRTQAGTYEDVTTKFDGVKILSADGFNAKGEPVNIYTAQWVNDQDEDFAITKTQSNVPVVIRKNVDIQITFIVANKYAVNAIDVLTQHDAFVDYMTSDKVYFKSRYANKEAYCVVLKEYKPTTQKLNRGFNSYMIGTITLHTLNAPSVTQEPTVALEQR